MSDPASTPCTARLGDALRAAASRARAAITHARAALAARASASSWSPAELAAQAPCTSDILLTCAAAVKARICRVGCAVRSLELPDGTDVVLGHEDTVKYLAREREGEGGRNGGG